MRYNGLSVAVSLLLYLISGGESGVVPGGGEVVPDRTGFQVLRLQTSDDELVERALQLADDHEVSFNWSNFRSQEYVETFGLGFGALQLFTVKYPIRT